MAAPLQIKAKITESYAIADDICRLTIIAPDIAQQAMPGQFVMVRAADEHDPLLRRPFSIHDSRPDGTIQLLFKVVGKGTKLLARKKSNEEIDLVGPLGRGFTVLPQNKHVLVGGGMGIAPLLFLVRFIVTNAPQANLQIMLGARTANEIGPLADEFRQVHKAVTFATDDGSSGHHGFVTDLLEQAIALGKIGQGGTVMYSCGPHAMLAKVFAIARKANLQCQVSLETMMACGISACLGCAIKKSRSSADDDGAFLHVCKHGPVFDAAEVEWK